MRKIPHAPPVGPDMKPVQREQEFNKPEIDDAAGTLGLFVNAVEESLREENDCNFVEVKALLLRAIGTTAIVNAV